MILASEDRAADFLRKADALFEQFSWTEARELGDWIKEKFPVVWTSRTPRGQKAVKERLKLFHHSLIQTYDHGESRVEQLRSDWNELRPLVDNLARYFSLEGPVRVPPEIQVGSNTYRNLVGWPEARLTKFVAGLEELWASLKGWRRDALVGGLKVVLAGPKYFRGTATGVYRSGEDALYVRATPRVLKRTRGYADPQYILVHELGHRYEWKRPLPEDFDRIHWQTTRYSRKEGERFAELFALGHYDLKGPWDPVVDRFERRMVDRGNVREASAEFDLFRNFVRDRVFADRDTGYSVPFSRLSKGQQAALFSDWRQHHRGLALPRERERHLIGVDRKVARFVAKRVADWMANVRGVLPTENINFMRYGGEVELALIPFESVQGHPRQIQLVLGLGKKSGWYRRFVTKGLLLSKHNPRSRLGGEPFQMKLFLHPERTYGEFNVERDRVEKEVYSVFLHEMTHARDRLSLDPSVEDLDDMTVATLYYNKPTEVRAFARQIVEEVREELERLHGSDDPEWISTSSSTIEMLLYRSKTWDRVKGWLTTQNRRRILESVASALRKFKEDAGGKVA